MVVIYDKCYTINALVINDSEIYSPSMPYTWKWAIGNKGETYPLGFFNNQKHAKIILNILSKTYPAKTFKAIPFIRLQDKNNLLNTIKQYDIDINHIYLESVINNKDSPKYNIYQFKQLFLRDTLA